MPFSSADREYSGTDNDSSRLSASDRQDRLLKQLNASNFVDIQTFVEELGASVSTIRRDLCDLERRGLLRRTHGGAIRIDQVASDTEAAVREATNVEEKKRIGAMAADMIVDGDTVIIDSGTTSRQVALCLAANDTLTFVTNGIDVFATLVAGGAKNVHFVGGEYVAINRSFGGSMAMEVVRKFNVDKAILSVTSVDVRRGSICTLSPQIGCVQQAMIDIAHSVIVVADHSKFGRAALSVIAPLEDVDCIVTDDATRPLLAQESEKVRAKCVFA